VRLCAAAVVRLVGALAHGVDSRSRCTGALLRRAKATRPRVRPPRYVRRQWPVKPSRRSQPPYRMGDPRLVKATRPSLGTDCGEPVEAAPLRLLASLRRPSPIVLRTVAPSGADVGSVGGLCHGTHLDPQAVDSGVDEAVLPIQKHHPKGN
jgi:hypothetical protein